MSRLFALMIIRWSALTFTTLMPMPVGQANGCPVNASGKKPLGDAMRRIWPWGNVWDFSKCRSGGYEPRSDKEGIYAAPVKSYPSGVSPSGCYNMAGNVAEWVDERYRLNKTSDGFNGDSGDNDLKGEARVVKGGGSDSYPSAVRPAARRGFEPDFRYFSIGFRCAMDAPAKGENAR